MLFSLDINENELRAHHPPAATVDGGQVDGIVEPLRNLSVRDDTDAEHDHLSDTKVCYLVTADEIRNADGDKLLCNSEHDQNSTDGYWWTEGGVRHAM